MLQKLLWHNNKWNQTWKATLLLLTELLRTKSMLRAAAWGIDAADNLRESISSRQGVTSHSDYAIIFNYLALHDAVGCIAACCSPLRVHNEFLCFYTWIDWLCRSKACLDTCGTQRTSHSNVESHNQAEMGQKRWSWLHSIQTLGRFICSENTTNPVARTNSLDMCCLATGTKKMSGHSG